MKHIEIWYEYISKNTWIVYNHEQNIDFNIIQGKDIKEWIHPISIGRVLWNGIWKELSKYIEFDEVDVLFYGRKEDFEILETSMDKEEISSAKSVFFGNENVVSDSDIFEVKDLLEMALNENKNGNITKCKEYLFKAYEIDKKDAAYYLGLLYANKKMQGYDIDKAVSYLKESAKYKNAKAQRELGYMYYQGKGVNENKIEAVKWFLCAAEQGDIRAAYNLGICYINGDGFEVDYESAYKWLLMAANGKDGDAQYELGLGFFKGYFGKNQKKALYWFFKALDSGINQANEYIDFLLGEDPNESD